MEGLYVEKPKIMVLGTFHLRYTPDLNRGNFEETFIMNQQKEIEKVVNSLKDYKPTKIAFEVRKEENDALNEEYNQYLDGQKRYEVNEIHQFGFRTAAELGHKEVYAVDWMESVGNRAIGQVYEWAEEKQPDKYKHITEYYWPKVHVDHDHINIYDLVQEMNTESRIKFGHEMYMAVAQIGKGTEYVGIDWLRWWYQRNLTIYSNLTNIASSSEDRILLIIGGAHIHLVTQFIQESGTMEVIPAINYLP